jgi:hypothetical protein
MVSIGPEIQREEAAGRVQLWIEKFVKIYLTQMGILVKSFMDLLLAPLLWV